MFGPVGSSRCNYLCRGVAGDRFGSGYYSGVEKRTRLGKVVGSIKTDPAGWTYWPEGDKWMLVAPSGARWKVYDTEEDVRREVAGRNTEWFAPLR